MNLQKIQKSPIINKIRKIILDNDEDPEEPIIENNLLFYKEVFNKKEADKLLPYRLIDYRIILQKVIALHYDYIYLLIEEKLKVPQEYTHKNSDKDLYIYQGFIRLSDFSAITIKNSYPIPLITDIIEHVKGTEYFTKLEIFSDVI
ncbi:hypothetical protein BCR32DRAFT_285422 [Anaeromyces robustus]|uniref:Uncharacterized protein n=1 Tax=Anaeromyces robustus TaxID=1754192 RepID=A0A1Y1WNV2_9FUNG|nr:hypothetical protein BCR32DRAFT_285422 [Anaeromyces robustus]|eukprot:ORX75172.1 hypothetical protein BCR32DRAFT_285422 [Anaeromyces robustus]